MDKLKQLNIEKVFVLTAGILGFVMIFVTPPFQSPDENNHFYRAYQLSEFKLLAERHGEKTGGMIPVSIVYTCSASSRNVRFQPENKQNITDITELINLPLYEGNRMFVEFSNTARYPFVPYIPQIVGIWTGRILELSPLAIMYLGRIINFLTWFMLVYYSIRISPFYKRLLLLLAVMPMTIFLAASLSIDALTIGISFFVIAFLFRLVYDSAAVFSGRELALIIAAGLLLALSKQVYFIILLIFLLIPKEKIVGKNKYGLFSILFLLCILANTLWFYMAKDMSVANPDPSVSVKGQIAFLSHNPWAFVTAMFKTLLSKKFISHFVGQLGWLDTQMPWAFLILYMIVLVAVALTDTRKNINIAVNHKLLAAAAFICIVVLICLSQYITWSAVGGKRVRGVQGRYFIPASPLFFMLFYNNKCNLSDSLKNIFSASFSLFSLLFTLFMLVKRYYI